MELKEMKREKGCKARDHSKAHKQMTCYKNKNEALAAENKRLSDRIARLEAKSKAQVEALESESSQVEQLKAKLVSKQARIDGLKGKTAILKEKLNEKEKDRQTDAETFLKAVASACSERDAEKREKRRLTDALISTCTYASAHGRISEPSGAT